MTHWMHPPRVDRKNERDRFDPAVEGARYHLSRELSLEIWARACAAATDGRGHRNEHQARRMFHEIAARAAARRARRRPDVGRRTRTGSGQDAPDSLDLDDVMPRAPGRETLVEVETARWSARNGALIDPAPTTAGESRPVSEPRAADELATIGAPANWSHRMRGESTLQLFGFGRSRLENLGGLAEMPRAGVQHQPPEVDQVDGRLDNQVDGKPGKVDGRPGKVDGKPEHKVNGKPEHKIDGKPEDEVEDRVDGKPENRIDGKPEDRIDGKPDKIDGKPDKIDGRPDKIDGKPDDKRDGSSALPSGHIIDGFGLGLPIEAPREDLQHKGAVVVDPRMYLHDPAKLAELPIPAVEPDPVQRGGSPLVRPRFKGLELTTEQKLDHNHERDVHETAQPLRSAGGGHSMSRPPTPKPPSIDPKLLSNNQSALDGYVARCEAERAKAKDHVAAQKLARTIAAQIDARAIAARVKQANDIKLAKLRSDAQRDKAATAKAAETQKRDGEVTVESLKTKLEDKLAADKQKFKDDFELKKQELTLRLQTQKETLVAESNRQLDNLRAQQKARVEDASKRWDAEKASFKKQAEDLMVQMRHQMEADKTKLQDQQQQTMKTASKKAAAVEEDANAKAADLIQRGDAKAKESHDRCVADGDRACTAAQAQADHEQDPGKKSQILAAGAAKKRDFITKGELSSRDIKAKAADEAQKVRDAGQTQKKKVIDTAASQVKAIDDKINALGPLAQQRQAENEQALQNKLKAGQDALDKKIGNVQKDIDKKQKEFDDKLKKLEDNGAKKLQSDYDRELTLIDQKASAARQALAHGSQKNLVQLEKLVDTTLTSIDRSIADTENKFDAAIASAENQAAAHVMAALRSIKAEADKLLVAIDKEYDAQIKAVQDAVTSTRKQIDDTAKGKMLEIEVHVATMFADLGQSDRLAAVKKQLRWYVEHGQTPPRGFGEIAAPPPAPAGKPNDKKDGKAAARTPEQQADDQKKAAEAEASRRADLDPDERAREDADRARQARTAGKPGDKLGDKEIDDRVEELMKKGQSATAAGAYSSATASVKAVYDDGRHAINRVVNQKLSDIENLEHGGTDPQVEQFKVDQKAGQDAADKIAVAASREGFWGKDPDKKAILQALEGKTPAQIEALRAALLAKNPPISLDDLVNNALSGDDQKEAKIRLTGDPTAGDIQALLNSGGWKPTGNEKVAAVTAGAVIAGPLGAAGAGILVNSFSGSGIDRERIEEILKRYPKAEDRARFAEAFQLQTGLDFNDFLKDNIPDSAARYRADKTPEAQKREQGQVDLLKKAQDDAARGKIDPKRVGESVDQLRDALNNFHFDGTRGDMVAKALEGKSPEEIALIMAEFKKRPGSGDLDAKLRTMLSGPALSQAEAIIHDDRDQIAVSKLMGAEQGSWTPWTVDDKKLQDTLEGITDPEQRRRVLAKYKAQTGVDLQDVIAHKMTGNDRKLAECLAKGDTLGAAEVKLEEATHGGWLNGMQDAAAQRFGIPKDIAKGATNVALFGIGGAFLPSGKTVTVDGYTIGDGGIHKVDSDQIYKVLESVKDPADRAKLAELYERSTGKSLDADMKATLGAGDPLGSGAKYDAYRALMEGDYEKAAACQAKAALSDGLFNDKDAFYKQLEGKSEWERKRIIAAFNHQYGGDNPHAFQAFTAAQLDGLDREKADLLVVSKDDPATGVVKLPPEFELRYAMDSVWVKAAHAIDGGTKAADQFFAEHPALRVAAGLLTLGQSEILLGEAKAASWMMSNWGVDDQKVLEVLRENPELAAKLDPKLKAEINYTLSGRSLHEAQYYLDQGVPQTPEDKIKFQLAMYQFDRGGSNAFSRGFTDLFSVSGKDYDAQYHELLALQVQLEQCKAAGLPLPPELAAQANWLAGMSSATGQQYEADKSKVANAAATAVGVVVGAVVTVLTGGVAGAILGAIFAGLATIGTKAAILGNSYTRGEMGVDIVMTAVNAVTAGVLKAEPFKAFCEGLKFLSAGGQQLLNAVIGGAGAAAVSSMVQTMLTSKDAHDLLSLIGQGARAGLWAAVTGGVNAAAMHALNGLLDSLATKLLGTNAVDELGQAYRKPGLVEAMLKGYVSGGGGAIASMAVEAMADPAMLSGSWDTVLANALQRFHEGGFQNAFQVGADHIEETRKATIEAAVKAAKEAQARGLPAEAQREAFAQKMAESAQTEAARAGKQLDGKPLAELGNEVRPHANGTEPHANGTEPHANGTEPHATGVDPHGTGHDPHGNGQPESTLAGGHDSTMAGAGGSTQSSGQPEAQLAEVVNKSHIVERARAALEAMPPEHRAAYEQLLHQAENPTQKVMLERAVAAGGSPEELKRLADYMKGFSETEIARRFTGAEALQFFQESCVPAALQAARAQVDPLYAFKLMMDPVFAAQEQAKALQETAGRRAQRDSDYDAKFNALVEQHPDLKSFLEDPTNFGGGTHGIEPSQMKGNQLLENLQHATGVQYDIVLRDGMKWQVKADGVFAPDAVPHDRIQAALERGLPVPYSANGHERLITDCFTKDGKVYYVIHDPMTGSTSSMPAEFMNFPMLRPASLMLPAEGPGGALVPAPSAHGSAPPDATPTEAGGRTRRPPLVEDPEMHSRLSEDTRQALSEISDARARRLVETVGDAAVNKLAPLLGAEDLSRMVRTSGPETVKKLAAVLTAQPALREGLAGQPELAALIARKPVLARTLASFPEALASVIKHPEAIKVLEQAFKNIEKRGVKPVAEAEKPKLSTPLTDEQVELGRSIARGIPGAEEVGDKIKLPELRQEPAFDTRRRNEPGYFEEYLGRLKAQAADAQLELNDLTSRIAAETDGEGAWRTKPKSDERATQKSDADYEGDASRLVDLAGSKIVYRTVDDLYRGLATVREAFGDNIVYIKDRFVKPADSGYRDILLNVKLSNGHIAELRLHLASIDQFAGIEHSTYEVRRSIEAIAALEKRKLRPEEIALIKALNRRTIPIFQQALDESTESSSEPTGP